MPACGDYEDLLTATACAASGEFTNTSAINVSDARYCVVFVDYDPAATAGRPAILPLVSNASTQPAAGDDAWFMMGTWDGTVTAQVLGGAVATGADYTAAPDVALALHRGLLVALEPADGATNELRVSFVLNVAAYKWLQFAYAEDGATGSPGTIAIKFALAV